MTQFVKNSRLRKVVSTLCAFAMLSSLIVVPAFAATPATGTLTSAGTTGVATVSGSASNGLNGVHTIETTGTIASKTKVTGAKSAAAVAAGKLGDINGFDTASLSKFVVTYDSVPTTITGLTVDSTVGDVVRAIASQVPSVTTGYVPVWGYAFIESKQVGASTIELSDDGLGGVAANGVFEAVFAGLNTVTGKAYTDAPAFSVIDKFAPVGGKEYTVAGAQAGYVDSVGAFHATVDPASKLYTAIKLGAGYDLVLATSKTVGFDAVGLAIGKAVVTVGAGVRDVAAPASFSVTPLNPAQAGKPETMTITLAGPAAGDATAAIDAACFTLPAGWSVPSTATVTAKVNGSVDASAVISGNVINASNFVLGVGDSLAVTVERVTPYTKAGDYNFAAAFKNVGTTTFTPVEVPALPTKSAATVHVAPVDTVASIALTASGNRAGGISVVSARLYDKYQNEFDGTEWARTVNFSNVTTPVVDPASTLSATSVSAFDANYGWTTDVTLSTKEGITTIQAVVPGEATATVSVNTAGVGEPAKLVLTSEKNPALSGESVRFHLGLVDAAGKSTSYITGDRTFAYFYGPGGQSSSTQDIVAKRSEAIFTASDSNTTWDMWAVDNQNGAVAQSDQLTQTWGAAPVVPGVYSGLKVTATPVVPVHDIDGVMGPNDGSYGYAPVGGQVALKVQAVDGNGMPVVPGKTVVVNATDNDATIPGTISSTTATLGVDGSYTFVVKSTYPTWTSGSAVFNGWTFTTQDTDSFTAYGRTLFYAPTVKMVETESNLALANGTDATAVTATVVDLFGAPVAGQKVMFSTNLGTLSAASAVTGADGKATVTIKSSDTGYANILAVIGTGDSQSASLYFTDYQAVLLGAPTLQQTDGDTYNVHLKFQIKSLDGSIVSFTKDNASGSVYWAGGDIDDINGMTFDNGVVDLDVDLYTYQQMAGTNAAVPFDAYVDVAGPLGSTTYYYSADFKLPIVNNAVLAAKGSTLLGKAGFVGSGFMKASRDESVSVVIGGTEYYVADVYVDGNGKINETIDLPAFVAAGTYDLVVDGITFPGALVVGNDLAIGAYPVLSMLTASSGTNYVTSGTNVTFGGAVMSYDGETIGWSALKVNLFRSASADGSNATLVGTMLTDQFGRFTFTGPVASTGYYFVTTDANATFGASDSRVTGITKVSVKTKTTMKVTSAPKSIGVNHSFTAKGSISGSHGKATTVAFKIYRSSGSLYKTYTVSLAAGQKTFSKTGMKIGSKGTFYVKAYHSDYNHLASTSAGWKIVVK